jgi:hypothetical protein
VGKGGLDPSGSVMGSCEYGNEPYEAGNSLISWATISLLRRSLLHGVSLVVYAELYDGSYFSKWLG